MKHLSRAEFTLYLGSLGLSGSQRQQIARHLSECAKCSRELSRIQLELKNMNSKNTTECQLISQQLIPYIEVELEPQKMTEIEQHLNQCDRCRILYNKIMELPSWEQVAATAVEIPAYVQKYIENAVILELKKTQKQPHRQVIQEKVVRDVNKIMNRVTLFFRPIQPAAVFRKGKSTELKVIEHPGGDLLLHTGLSAVLIELSSIFDDFTVNGKTDDTGEIVFIDLKKGDYVVNAAGYKLAQIKIKGRAEL
ncbi:MAG: anti-sigma factor family protein [Methanosarcinaceae archaeon]